MPKSDPNYAYKLHTLTAVNYYPYGSERDGQSYQAPEYNFGFNAMLRDDEFKGDGRSYSTLFREYDPLLGRWMSVDPLMMQFASYSPYIFCFGNPIKFIDPDGQAPNDPDVRPGVYKANPSLKTIGFLFRNNNIAVRIGDVTQKATNISTNSARFATRENVLYGTLPKTQEERGSENGAFRHALWQSTITSEFGSKIAKEAGNAHEADPFVYLTVRSFSNLTDADQTVDLLNNQIGRSIGEAHKGAKMDVLANIVLDEFKNNGLYTASKNNDGNWIVSKTKLSTEKYNKLKEIFKGLNENGRRPQEQKNTDDKVKFHKESNNNWKGPKR